MPQVVDNINRRIAQGLAVSEASVRSSGDKVLVELPGFTNAAQASALLGPDRRDEYHRYRSQPAVHVGDNRHAGAISRPLTGSNLDTNQISAGLDSSSGKPIVTFAFTGKAKTDLPPILPKHRQLPDDHAG